MSKKSIASKFLKKITEGFDCAEDFLMFILLFFPDIAKQSRENLDEELDDIIEGYFRNISDDDFMERFTYSILNIWEVMRDWRKENMDKNTLLQNSNLNSKN